MARGDTKTNNLLDIAAHGTRAEIIAAMGCCATRTQQLIGEVGDRIITEEETRAEADQELQAEIDEIRNNPDVVDIVWTYADLQAYDTQRLTDNDIVRVLADETHDGNSTYYRYDKTNDSWTYIGQSKQYDDFVGTDGTTAGESGLVPAPTTADAGKFLKADGTWDEAGSSVNVVQTTGASTTDVMSQNAATSMVYSDPATKRRIVIPNGTVSATANGDIIIGSGTCNAAGTGVTIGSSAYNNSSSGVAMGYYTDAGTAAYSVAIGAGAKATRRSEFNIGTGDQSWGYNNTKYRLLGGVHDPIDAHDAANKEYVDTAVAGAGGGEETRGLAKELTDEDVNGKYTDWDDTDESHFNAVAAWKLAPGIYHRGASMTKSLYIAPYNTIGSDATFIVAPLGDYGYSVLLLRARTESGVYVPGHWYIINRLNTITTDGPLSPLVIDNLSSTYTIAPLSANQGKVLNDKITALEARIAALEGN